jgi:amino acid adenylation domain-containing protein
MTTGFARQSVEAAGSQHNSMMGFLLLSPVDQQALIAWNDTAEPSFLMEACLLKSIETTCRNHPDGIALSYGEHHLSYQAFGKAANVIAGALYRQGVGPETIVIVAMDRSIEMVLAIHGITRSGSAFLPIDPNMPASWIADLIERSGAKHILTSRDARHKLQDILKDEPEWRLFCVEDLLLAPAGPKMPATPVHPMQAAYVLYTSGSTGKPKGVINTHQALLNRLLWMQKQYPIGPGDVVLHKTPTSFDVSVWELFWPLMTGATMAIAKPGEHRDTQALIGRILHHGATICHFVPSFLNLWLGEDAVHQCRSLRHVFASGEELPVTVAQRLHRLLPAQLHNLYGPTEAAIDVTAWTYEPSSASDSLPIGKPIANLAIHILDADLNCMSIGQTGDLHIAGIGLARGYLNKPGLTASVFLPSPVSPHPGERLYASGDRGCWRHDGQIAFFGRNDRQIKLRGMRIDLGEIESILSTHPAVASVIVRPHKRRTQPSRMRYESVEKAILGSLSPMRPFLRGALVAQEAEKTDTAIAVWISPSHKTQTPLDLQAIRQWMAEHVPDHLVPALWATIDAPPLMDNGKLDASRLPEPQRAATASQRGAVSPLQDKIAHLWAEVLQCPLPGPEDNFFALGGDSLLALRVVAAARERGLSFDVATMLSSPTLADLALHVLPLRMEEPFTPLPAFALLSALDRAKIGSGIVDAYPLAIVQAGLVFHDEASRADASYRETFAYRVKGPFDQTHFRSALDLMTQNHPILRSCVDLDSFTTPMQLVHAEATVPLSVEWLSETEPAAFSEKLATAERKIAFVWTEPPLLRIRVRVLDGDLFEIYLVFHDLILDGWSASLLVTGLLLTYDAVLDGRPPPVVPQTPRFADYIAAETAASTDTASAAFFAKLLNRTPSLNFPPKRADAVRSSGPFSILDVAIDPQISSKLQDLAAASGVGLKQVLLAAHIRVLSHLFASSDVITGLETNGRLEVAGSERILGMHLNTVPMRMNLRSCTWRELIAQTAQAERALWPHRRYPYANLQERSGEGLLVKTVFNYVHFHVFHDLVAMRRLQLVDAGGFGASHFPFRAEFSLDPFSGQAHLCLECNQDQLGAGLIQDTARLYQRVLADIANNPDAHHDAPRLFNLPEPETPTRERLQDQEPETWLDLLHQQARLRPNSIALSAGASHLSYGALWARARRIAQALCAKGIGPECIVAIHLHDPLEQMLALIGVQMAGAAYMPISAQWREEAIGHVFKRADLILHDRIATRDYGGISLAQLVADAPLHSPLRKPDRDTLAYVMHTSGSTGLPRAVMATHANLAHSLQSRLRFYKQDAGSVFLLVPALSSDSSIAVIFWSLSCGGRLVLQDRDMIDCARLETLIACHGVTDTLLTPSLYGVLLAEASGQALQSLERVIVAGEVAYRRLGKLHAQILPQAALLNEYGPTEASVWSSVGHWDDQQHQNNHAAGWSIVSLPIGSACAHCHLSLLDSFMLPVMPGQAGEIVIGGCGITRGYRQDPATTALRFRPDPDSIGGRTYRTGDFARLLPSGELEFLGRRDRQVGINGYRVELAEIENVLLELAFIHEAAVIARIEHDRTVLSAFVVPVDHGCSDAEEIAAQLRMKAPRHFIPAEWIIVDTLPKNPNGKVDYPALSRDRLQLQEQARLRAILNQIESLSEEEALQAFAMLDT